MTQAHDREPTEGYLDDDFARFRAARLERQTEPEPEPEPEPEAFFGTATFQRSKIRDAIQSDAQDLETPADADRVHQARRPTARRAPPPPLPPLRSRRSGSTRRVALPEDTPRRPTRRPAQPREARVRRAGRRPTDRFRGPDTRRAS